MCVSTDGNRGGDVGVGVRLHMSDSESSLLSFSELHYPATPPPPKKKIDSQRRPFLHLSLLCDSRCTQELSEHLEWTVCFWFLYVLYVQVLFRRHNDAFLGYCTMTTYLGYCIIITSFLGAYECSKWSTLNSMRASISLCSCHYCIRCRYLVI